MIFFGGGLGPSFWGFYEMGPVFYTFLHLQLGIRLSTIKRILYGAPLAFTTFLFLPFHRLADSSFTILGLSFFGSVFPLLTLGGVGTYIISAVFATLLVYIYTLSFFSSVFPSRSGFGRMLGSSIVYACV